MQTLLLLIESYIKLHSNALLHSLEHQAGSLDYF